MWLMAEQRSQKQVKLTQVADRALDTVRADVGMTKVELLSRVATWFAGQPSIVQKLVLGLVDEELLPAARQVLASQLGQPKRPGMGDGRDLAEPGAATAPVAAPAPALEREIAAVHGHAVRQHGLPTSKAASAPPASRKRSA